MASFLNSMAALCNISPFCGQVWQVQSSELLGITYILQSARHSGHFGCIVERSRAEGDSRSLVLRRRCAKRSIEQKWVSLLHINSYMQVLWDHILTYLHSCFMDRIAAWQGGGLFLDGDLSRQLVASPELQDRIRLAGLSVELQFDGLSHIVA